MASKRLKKKKQAAAVLQKQQPVQEKEPVTMEMEQNAQEIGRASCRERV